MRTLQSLVCSLAAAGTIAGAGAQTFSLNAVYSCANGRTKVKVTGCTGTGDTDLCGVQHLNGAGTAEISPKTSENCKSLAAALQSCQLQPKTPPAVPTPPATAPQLPARQVGAGGIKVGDTVSVNSAFGWMNGKVFAIRGNSFHVHNQVGADVWKDYPAEVRRIGPSTAADHAAGIYELHDRVQVNIGGQWMEGVVITTMGMEYQVQLPGNRTAWAQPPNLRPSAAPPPALPKAGQPPKAGLTSCAGKIEGRYSSMGGFAGLTIVFRSGKATLADDDVYECWMGGGKIYLHKPGGGPLPDMPLDINADGTLDSPMGELKKKGN